MPRRELKHEEFSRGRDTRASVEAPWTSTVEANCLFGYLYRQEALAPEASINAQTENEA